MLAALALMVASRAGAEPYLMVREGAKCSDCHTNLTGGGMRTAFAQIHAKDILHDLDLLPIPAGVKGFNGQLTSYARIGGDLRVRDTMVFEDRPDTHGRVPGNKAFRRHVASNDLDLNQFRFYGQVDLYPDILTLYADEDFTSGANTREAMALVHNLTPWNLYFKGGRFYPAYGLRAQDDQAFIRDRTGYTFANPDEGVEIGLMPGPFFFATSITNGAPGDKDVAVTANGYAVFQDVPLVRSVIAGLGYARQSDKRYLVGPFLGFNLWKLTLLGELDKIEDRSVASTARRDDYATYLETDLLLLEWLNLRGTFEFIKVANDRDQTRYTIGAEPFINRFLQPRLQYRINNGPGTEPQLNQPELWAELHVFF